MGPVVADLEMQGLTVDKDPKMNTHITAFLLLQKSATCDIDSIGSGTSSYTELALGLD